MKTVYVAHPLRGDVTGNIQRVSEICRELSLAGEVIPLSPLHAFGFMDSNGCQKQAMGYCLKLLSKADELHLYGKWWRSEGCKEEIHFALANRIPIKVKTVPPLGVSV